MSTLILPFLIFLTIPPNFLLPLLPTVFFCLTLCFMCMSESDESDWQRLCLIKFSLNPKLSLPLPLSFYLKGQRVTEREECVSAVMGMTTLEPSPSIYLLNTVLHTHSRTQCTPCGRHLKAPVTREVLLCWVLSPVTSRRSGDERMMRGGEAETEEGRGGKQRWMTWRPCCLMLLLKKRRAENCCWKAEKRKENSAYIGECGVFPWCIVSFCSILISHKSVLPFAVMSHSLWFHCLFSV